MIKRIIFDVDNTRKFIHDYLKNGDKGAATGENYSKIVWSFFVFQQWYYAYIENKEGEIYNGI